jgi:hypothetical protein
MKCPQCGSTDVNTQAIQSEGKNKKYGNGFGGHTNNFARGVVGISTLGLSNLFWKKSKGNEKIKYKYETVCVCQECGHTWTHKPKKDLLHTLFGKELDKFLDNINYKKK